MDEIEKAYHCYDDEYFIRVLKPGILPEVRNVKSSNFVDINYKDVYKRQASNNSSEVTTLPRFEHKYQRIENSIGVRFNGWSYSVHLCV